MTKKMNCVESLKYLYLYLDSELDAKTSVDISHHLSTCGNCNDRFRKERELEALLVESIKRVQSPDEFWNATFDELGVNGYRFNEMGTRGRSVKRIWRYILPIAATILIALCFLFMSRSENHSDLMLAAVKDHSKFLREGAQPKIQTGSAKELEEYFRGKLNFEVTVPVFSDIGIKIVGGSLCKLNHVPVAYLIYRRDGVPISFFIMDSGSLTQFPQMLRTLQGNNCVEERSGDYNFVAMKHGKVVFCAVSEIDANALRQMMR